MERAYELTVWDKREWWGARIGIKNHCFRQSGVTRNNVNKHDKKRKERKKKGECALLIHTQSVERSVICTAWRDDFFCSSCCKGTERSGVAALTTHALLRHTTTSVPYRGRSHMASYQLTYCRLSVQDVHTQNLVMDCTRIRKYLWWQNMWFFFQQTTAVGTSLRVHL